LPSASGPLDPSPMNPARFGPSPFLHLLGPGLAGFFGYMAYRSSVDPFVHGGLPLRIALVGGCACLAVFVLWLYLRSGAVRYEVTDAGLRIVRPWSRKVVPWPEIRRIDWNLPLHCIFLRGESGTLAFTSTDLFPRILDFLHAIRERSRCALDPRLERLLDDDAGPPPR
jgi:hypothetical protein